MNKILIIGSEGFIGGHLIDYFIKNGFDVYGCDLYEASSRNYHYRKISRLSPEWEQLFGTIKFDSCINAAGSGNVPYSVLNPINDFESNSLDVILILDHIRRYQPTCKFLQISSAAVYGNPERLPVRESDPKHPLSPYGWHKLISEQLCKEYSSLYNIKIAVVRPFSVYGPGLRKQIFWDLFQKSSNADKIIELFGTGNETRDFIYIDDVVKGMDLILENAPMQGEQYNLATGIETSISTIVRIFFEFLDKSPQITFNKITRIGDPINWQADIGKLRSLGFTPFVDIKNGMQQHVAWLKNGSLGR